MNNNEYLKMPWSIEDTIENLKEVKHVLVYKMLKENCDGKGKQDADEVCFDFDRAIEALEKQIPKKPKTEPFYGGRCIVCNALIPNKSVNYCHKCGQKLYWGE